MKKPLSLISTLSIMLYFFALSVGCVNPNKVHRLEEPLSQAQDINSREQVGLQEEELVVQKKSRLTEELRKIREEVLNLEDDLLGNREYQKQGLYGKLRRCRGQAKDGDKRFAVKLPPRIADTESSKMIERNSGRKGAIDQNNNLVLFDEEGLGDQINRYQEQRKKLHSLEDEIREKLSQCQGEMGR